MSDPQHTPAGGFFYRPFIPLQVTGTFLEHEPDVVEKLAAVTDPALKAKHKRADEARERFQSVMDGVRKRHGKPLKVVDGKFFRVVNP